MKKVNTAVVGCGAISDIYIQNMTGKFSTLEVTACCAAHIESARRKAEQYGLTAGTYDEILADPTVELLVILTPPPAHYELVKRGLLAGKHVYVEKPLAVDVSEAAELVSLARARGLLLGCAPETFMGSSLQTARKAIDEGLIGDVTSFHVTANRDLTILASLYKFLRGPGGGIMYDYGVYYLTALVSLLGPMSEVYARVDGFGKTRVDPIPTSPGFGQEFLCDNESRVNAVLTTKSGISGTFALNGDSALFDQAYFTIHGTGGILSLSDANQFGGQVTYIPASPREQPRVLDPVSDLSGNERGIGPSQMGQAIRAGGHPLASSELALHVLDIVERTITSGRSGRPEEIFSTCERPDIFPGRGGRVGGHADE